MGIVEEEHSSRTLHAFGTETLLSMGSLDAGEVAKLVLGLGLVTAVGVFVYANVVYTPEILQGAKELRKMNREAEIQKLLGVVRKHQSTGKDLVELRVPLETVLGSSLEDYVQIVLEPGGSGENNFTAADTELATILQKSI